MAKGLHLLKARLQAVHYRMLGAEQTAGAGGGGARVGG